MAFAGLASPDGSSFVVSLGGFPSPTFFATHPYFTVSEVGEVPVSRLDVHPSGIDPLFLTLVPLLAFPLNYQSQCQLRTPNKIQIANLLEAVRRATSILHATALT